MSRLEILFDLGVGGVLGPWLRRQDEGRALAAVAPFAASLAALIRRWAWPMPRRFGSGPEVNQPEFHPRGLAVSSSGGDIVVCDARSHCVQVFRPDGRVVCGWGGQGTAPGQLRNPMAVAVSPADEVFVSDCVNCRIQVFRLDGSFVRSWGSEGEAPGQFRFTAGVAVHGDLVLVSDEGNHRIQCFTLDGTFVRMWGSEGEALGEFVSPGGLAVSSTGEVFVCDFGNCRVQVFGLDGAFRRSWGGPLDAFGPCDDPCMVAVSAAGEVLVSSEARVCVYLADGTFVRCLHLPAVPDVPEPVGVAVSPSGDVVVGDCRNHVVYVEPAGA